jgi:hypothetical protein
MAWPFYPRRKKLAILFEYKTPYTLPKLWKGEKASIK